MVEPLLERLVFISAQVLLSAQLNLVPAEAPAPDYRPLFAHRDSRFLWLRKLELTALDRALNVDSGDDPAFDLVIYRRLREAREALCGPEELALEMFYETAWGLPWQTASKTSALLDALPKKIGPSVRPGMASDVPFVISISPGSETIRRVISRLREAGLSDSTLMVAATGAARAALLDHYDPEWRVTLVPGQHLPCIRSPLNERDTN